ncbi:MAG: carbohydrate ABC transporter permease [Clostridia bacterium]|nr:carbohydrate ABC transporter permease [Clostridia bacterium]MBQ4157991.1 carbohydrate ABC transporter permease [Clostridia bacterium]
MQLFRSKWDKVVNIVNIAILALFLIVELYPLYFTLIASISDPYQVSLNNVTLIPNGFSLESYKEVFSDQGIWIGYANSLFYAVTGTLINLAFTLSCAFCFARKPAFKGKGIVTGLLVFTMYFGGGLVPSYLLIRQMGLLDTRWVLILPGALSVYNMIIVRTFYQTTIPDALYESARIDGCTDIGMLLRITLPLSKPIIAVMTLFFAVGHWNSYFGALIYVTDVSKQPLQLVLRRILILDDVLSELSLGSFSAEAMKDMVQKQALAVSMKYAVIYVASLPLLIAYPFVQKHFVKGIMVGAVKG